MEPPRRPLNGAPCTWAASLVQERAAGAMLPGGESFFRSRRHVRAGPADMPPMSEAELRELTGDFNALLRREFLRRCRHPTEQEQLPRLLKACA